MTTIVKTEEAMRCSMTQANEQMIRALGDLAGMMNAEASAHLAKEHGNPIAKFMKKFGRGTRDAK